MNSHCQVHFHLNVFSKNITISALNSEVSHMAFVSMRFGVGMALGFHQNLENYNNTLLAWSFIKENQRGFPGLEK